jgi:hypothetical protein
MIITIEAIEGNSGQGQPVFSRTGVTTVYQHKVFQENPLDKDDGGEKERKKKLKQMNQ